jgi:pimeloyl-ACP methyl ester carboxylesterase
VGRVPSDLKRICSRVLPVACAALFLLGCAAASVRPSAPDAVLNRRESFEESPLDGSRVFVLEAGHPALPPLVLIHGLGSLAGRDFEPILPALSARFHVLAFDLPGFGRSSPSRKVYSPSSYARFVHAMVTRHFPAAPGATAGPEVHVFGHSMGAGIAALYAHEHPEQVARLALLDVAGLLHYREYMRRVAEGVRAQQGFFSRTAHGTKAVLLAIGLWPAPAIELVEGDPEMSSTLLGYFSYNLAAALLYVDFDFGPALRDLRMPVWIGRGSRDVVSPQVTTDALRFLVAPVRHREFEHSAHVPMRTEPALLAEELIAFFATPIEPAPVVPRQAAAPSTSTRMGTCHRERNRIFEGDYDSIVLYRCKGMILRNVRARSLRIGRSEVELQNVLVDGERGVVMDRSEAVWVGGRVDAPTCMQVARSSLQLVAVQCRYTQDSLRVHGPATLRASLSALDREAQSVTLHGEYDLIQTTSALLPAVDAAALEPKRGENSHVDLTTRIADEQLKNEDLRGANLHGVDLSDADMRRADLRGADLSHADLRDTNLARANLRGANLRAANLRQANLTRADLSQADLRDAVLDDTQLRHALYDANTRFPPRFDPTTRGMRPASHAAN